MKDSTCKIYYESEFVSWVIPKNCIKDTLLKKPGGLLFLNVESAGEVQFKNDTCKINSKSEKTCDKKMKSIKFKKGNKDSVMTPLAVVNFHTHPLSCYIEAETVWGWPSGEDLAQCLNFAKDNNLTHIIFSIEGTYIIDVNKTLINKINNRLFKIIRNNIQEIFKLTHKHRMYYNEPEPHVSLNFEFNRVFLKPLGMNIYNYENILCAWIDLVNKLTLDKLKILSNIFFNIINIKIIDNDEAIKDLNIFNIFFVKNNTIQWDKKLKDEEIFNKLKEKEIEIELPNKIEYKAPFIKEECKLGR